MNEPFFIIICSFRPESAPQKRGQASSKSALAPKRDSWVLAVKLSAGFTSRRSPLALAGEKVLAGDPGELRKEPMAELSEKRSVRIKILSMGQKSSCASLCCQLPLFFWIGEGGVGKSCLIKR